MNILSIIILILFLVPLGYLLLLAAASLRPARLLYLDGRAPSTRFRIAIPAHDEAAVIGATVKRLLDLNYPKALYKIYVVADHCTDETALLARQSGAVVYERDEGPRGGKASALSWLFRKILEDECDAVVIFDADTKVDTNFLRVMDARLAQGARVVQGQHIISNPGGGWFPSLIWAMFLIDNRFQNLGRSNFGCSAKNMGDSICLRVDVLRRFGWGEGLTEDYQFRQRLLLEKIRIVYEPRAIGYGEAPLTWNQAKSQRARWLRGTYDSSKLSTRQMLAAGIRQRNLALLEGALQALFPSFSTLTVLGLGILSIQMLTNLLIYPVFSWAIIAGWAGAVAILFAYPIFGLALERAPIKAYQSILLGPFFILWRTGLAFTVRLKNRQVSWVRTPHGETGLSDSTKLR